MTDSVLVVAAEASSSLYALRLLETWKTSGRKVDAFGIGSREMEKAGFQCVGRSEELAIMGLQEILKHLPQIRRVFNAILEEVDRRKPKFALLLDYPGFNLRLAKALKKRGVKVVYYISPQVWAWRTGRVKEMKKTIDHMLVLFPFEEKFYQDHGITVDFVGHPALDEMQSRTLSASELKVQRNRFGIGDDEMVLGLMPGSRRAEIEHHLATLLETAKKLVRENPKLRVVLMVAPPLSREYLKSCLGEVDFPIQIIKEDPLDMIALADVILVASGTATLMVGLMEKPMVILYKMNAVTAWVARRLVTKTPFFGMVNLIMNRQIVPELFQEQANPERLAEETRRFLNDVKLREQTVIHLREMKERLGSRGATARVAKIVDRYFS